MPGFLNVPQGVARLDSRRVSKQVSLLGAGNEPNGSPNRATCIYTLFVEPVQSQCVCTSLRMVTRSVNRLYDQALSRAGLRVTGYSIMSRLAVEGSLTVGELAGRLAMERTTCTREVAPLVESGLVETVTGSDRRHRLLRLTDRGARKRSQAYPLWENVQRMVADEFGATEVVDLLARLRRLRESSDQLSSTGKESH
jgi:DNA-binding MarR family transcriptional regulator